MSVWIWLCLCSVIKWFKSWNHTVWSSLYEPCLRVCRSFFTSDGVAYLSVCMCSVSAAVAFSFLEDLRWEFMASFDSSAVARACRPYPFLDFG